MTTNTIKLEKAFFGDFCDWPECIDAQLTSSIQQTINNIRQILIQNKEIQSIDIELPQDFLSHKEQRRLFEACAYDVNYLTIYRHSYCFYLQAKYDAHIQAEYIEV